MTASNRRWNGKAWVYDAIHHIDGDPRNNDPANLVIVERETHAPPVPNPRRPHPFQTSDSRFSVVRSVIDGDRWYVLESWWFIAKNREEEDAEAMHGPYPSKAAAEAEKARREA